VNRAKHRQSRADFSAGLVTRRPLLFHRVSDKSVFQLHVTNSLDHQCRTHRAAALRSLVVIDQNVSGVNELQSQIRVLYKTRFAFGDFRGTLSRAFCSALYIDLREGLYMRFITLVASPAVNC
jgi:hypothetical protein